MRPSPTAKRQSRLSLIRHSYLIILQKHEIYYFGFRCKIVPNEKWEYVMASLDSDAWRILFGETYETLNAFTPGKGLGDSAPDFLLEMFHPQEILKDTQKRNLIIGIMPEDYIQDLALKAGIHSDNIQAVYDGLKSIKYTSRVQNAFLQFFGIEPIVKPEEDIIVGVETISEEFLEYPLRGYQRQIIADLENVFYESRRCMVQMPTGSGKTRTAMYYISKMMNESEEYTVLWLAYSKELCDQASSEFSKIWHIRGNKDVTVFRYYGNSDCVLPDKKCNGIIFSTLSKIGMARKKDNTVLAFLSDKIDLVVFDEAHQSIAPQYSSIVKDIILLNDCSKLIGLTATPGRTWNDPEEDQKLSDFYYRNIVRIKTQNETPNQMLTRMGYLSSIEWRYCECNSPRLSEKEIDLIRQMQDEDELPSSVIEKLSYDVKRNTKIVSEVQQLLKEGHKRILLFATSVEHSRIMCGLLNVVCEETNEKCRVDCIVGSTDPGTRENIIKDFKSDNLTPHVICNFNVLSTGFDAPNIDAGIIARPTKSLVLFSQMVGRMIRGPMTPGGTNTATIVSVVDLGLPGFKDSNDNWVDVWK